ncbi:MAG: hypothetical protein ACRD5L_05365 [Bryobacteraceae bacterium]
MDLPTALLIYYGLGIVLLVAIAGILYSKGRRGKWPRAFLVSAGVGIVVPLVIYFFYPHFFPPPVDPPPHPIDPKAPLLPQFVASIKLDMLPAIGRQVGYSIARILDPFFYGVIAVVSAFALSFLIPHRGRLNHAK